MFLKNVVISLADNFADRGFKMLVDAYMEEKLSKKYEEVEALERAEYTEPLKLVIRKSMPSFLIPYSGKDEVLLGFTWCPFCREEYENMRDKILEDKADAIWIDRDLVGEVLAEDLELDYVPAKIKVKATPKKAIVSLLDDEGKVVKTVTYTDLLEVIEDEERKMSRGRKGSKPAEKTKS